MLPREDVPLPLHFIFVFLIIIKLLAIHLRPGTLDQVTRLVKSQDLVQTRVDLEKDYSLHSKTGEIIVLN
jgi:hypothetical protein